MSALLDIDPRFKKNYIYSRYIAARDVVICLSTGTLIYRVVISPENFVSNFVMTFVTINSTHLLDLFAPCYSFSIRKVESDKTNHF